MWGSIPGMSQSVIEGKYGQYLTEQTTVSVPPLSP